MANEQRRLIAEDVSVYRGEFDTTAIATALDKGELVQIATKASSASKFGDLVVGDYFIHNNATAITMTAGDTYYPLAVDGYNQMMDLTSATIEITAEKIDTTALADAFRVARSGKRDLTGTAEMVYIKGITDDPDAGVMNSFFRIAKITNAGVATVTPVKTSPYLLVLWIDSNDDVAGNDRVFIVLKVEFESFSIGGAMGNAQMSTAPFHIVGGFTPTIYKIANA